ncbi:MAG: (deoxy)nucleoside triphosphate pyrophosphohydrolase [Archangium sp.]|nr:(deoxy)nucleoside triphosphate pyrophosphohydrolase [Archangium sp.]MDP3157748.1 (deoxy)nucleoside triphosphate pyrophosphohydrolase [Archangium sp.]MDP3575267.1 (deoxy)nucleoside triphosphate pyrophosphohydrolase [Archangium sp.]
MKTIRVVAALIADPRDPSRFLVQQRLPDKSRANLWEFPGGKVEPGETDEAALVRECQEELAVELRVGRRLWSTTHEYDDFTVQLELFAADIESGEPKPLGAQALRFCTPKEMQALPFCEADIPLLELLLSPSPFGRGLG